MTTTSANGFRTREHGNWGHGLQPGTDADLNCVSCQREDAARTDAQRDFTAACERTVAPGQCTGCEADAAELIPWSGEKLCWRCVDVQLDLMAAAILADAPVSVGGAGLR